MLLWPLRDELDPHTLGYSHRGMDDLDQRGLQSDGPGRACVNPVGGVYEVFENSAARWVRGNRGMCIIVNNNTLVHPGALTYFTSAASGIQRVHKYISTRPTGYDRVGGY